jgi:hypothetical protein
VQVQDGLRKRRHTPRPLRAELGFPRKSEHGDTGRQVELCMAKRPLDRVFELLMIRTQDRRERVTEVSDPS